MKEFLKIPYNTDLFQNAAIYFWPPAPISQELQPTVKYSA